MPVAGLVRVKERAAEVVRVKERAAGVVGVKKRAAGAVRVKERAAQTRALSGAAGSMGPFFWRCRKALASTLGAERTTAFRHALPRRLQRA